ncbi:MAG: P-II family nitrogen regulator [Bacteroidales bacterium]|nr:P-II family nitrogen regulator [Bacteroidales bacterium]MBN2818622.1 P-II family nitrogen regulator [Bacteroidales bacterium]
MKKVEAIIRKTKFDDVKEALNEAGIEFFSFWEVRGVGKATESRIYRGVKYDTSTIERIMISFYMRDQYLEPAIKAILSSAKTGSIGDGKVFVSDIQEAYRIRTGEQGEKSLYIEGE